MILLSGHYLLFLCEGPHSQIRFYTRSVFHLHSIAHCTTKCHDHFPTIELQVQKFSLMDYYLNKNLVGNDDSGIVNNIKIFYWMTIFAFNFHTIFFELYFWYDWDENLSFISFSWYSPVKSSTSRIFHRSYLVSIFSGHIFSVISSTVLLRNNKCWMLRW